MSANPMIITIKNGYYNVTEVFVFSVCNREILNYPQFLIFIPFKHGCFKSV